MFKRSQATDGNWKMKELNKRNAQKEFYKIAFHENVEIPGNYGSANKGRGVGLVLGKDLVRLE